MFSNVPRTALRRVTKLKQVASARELHRQAASTNVHDLLVTYAQKSTRPLTLSKLLSFGHPLTPDSILASASYALTEIPRRLARRIHSLEKLPFIVGTNPYVARTLDSFRSSFEWLARYPEVTTLRENEEFAKQLEMLVEKHKDDIPRMAKGFQECTRYMTQSAINTYLDSAIRNRIAVRLIAGQHISISHALHDHKAIHTIGSQQDVVAPIDDDGVVDMRCSPLEIIEDVELHVREMCEATFGVAPKIVVDGHVDVRFAYVPAHVQYILSELLKNSFRATVENHWKLHGPSTSQALPPIQITISLPPKSEPVPYARSDASPESTNGQSSNQLSKMSQLPPPTPRRALSLRIRDQGGGVSPANISRIFSYAFTTASHLKRGAYAPPSARSSEDSDESSELGRLGVLNYDADSGADEGGLSGPYAAQHVGGGVGLSTGLGSGVGTIAGLGYGLPMSRLYTRYFGGELNLIPMDGWGTDVFIKLRCLDEAGDVEI